MIFAFITIITLHRGVFGKRLVGVLLLQKRIRGTNLENSPLLEWSFNTAISPVEYYCEIINTVVNPSTPIGHFPLSTHLLNNSARRITNVRPLYIESPTLSQIWLRYCAFTVCHVLEGYRSWSGLHVQFPLSTSPKNIYIMSAQNRNFLHCVPMALLQVRTSAFLIIGITLTTYDNFKNNFLNTTSHILYINEFSFPLEITQSA